MRIKILILKEKHGDRIFNITTEKLKKGACLDILKTNISNGYYQDKAHDLAVEILTQKSAIKAFNFVLHRSNNDHEYETVEINYLEEYE